MGISKRWAALLLFLMIMAFPALGGSAWAETAAPAAAAADTTAAKPEGEPQKVKVGLFITHLYDFDIPKRSFNANFWAWYLSADPKYKAADMIEIVNAKTSTIRFSSTTPKDDPSNPQGKIYWEQGKNLVTLSQDWNITNFPFDRQVLKIIIEDGQNDASQVVFVPDAENSRIDDTVTIPGWTIESFKLEGGDKVYDTTYGDPSLQGTSTYSRVTANITVKRNGARLLGSMFIGFFVAFLLTNLTYFLDTKHMAGSRIGLCSGAIFASVGNKYAVDNFLPPASTFTLSDGIETSTFLAIIFTILVVVVLRRLDEEDVKMHRWINRTGAVLNFTCYLGYNILMLSRAL